MTSLPRRDEIQAPLKTPAGGGGEQHDRSCGLIHPPYPRGIQSGRVKWIAPGSRGMLFDI